jgi:hypothetical protein
MITISTDRSLPDPLFIHGIHLTDLPGERQDVFIVPFHQGKGYSKQLMEFILGEPSLKTIKIWRLATSESTPSS